MPGNIPLIVNTTGTKGGPVCSHSYSVQPEGISGKSQITLPPAQALPRSKQDATLQTLQPPTVCAVIPVSWWGEEEATETLSSVQLLGRKR